MLLMSAFCLTAFAEGQVEGTVVERPSSSGGESDDDSGGGSGGGSSYHPSADSAEQDSTVQDCPRDNTCPAYPYQDLNLRTWYHDGIHYCVENGLMNGTSGTTFSPNQPITRAMIVTILYRMEGSPAAELSSFADVAPTAYYASAVAWAQANGIVTGYSQTRFDPNNSITREQLAAIMHRYAKYRGVSTAASGSLSGYADAGQISSYAVEAMAWANSAGLITGTSGSSISPKANATRAQAAAIIYRFCDMTGLAK